MIRLSLLSSYLSRTDDGYVYKDVWTEYAKDALSAAFTYLSIALFVALVGIGIFVKLKKPSSSGAFFRTATIIAVTFALTVAAAMLTLGFAKISEKGYAKRENGLLELVPPLILGGVIVVGIIATYLARFFSQKAFKITAISALSAVGTALVATVVCLIIYFSRTISTDGWYGESINNLALYLTAAGLVAALVGAAFLTDVGNTTRFDSRCIALAGICIALSFALSYVKIFSMPQGGSITLASLLPLMLFAYVYGPKKGVLAGCCYGALQAMQNPYLIHPAQFILDYPAAFAAAGLVGAFSKIRKLDRLPQAKFALGAIVAGALRFTAHVFSGVFAFGADAGGQNLWAYSAAYNSYVFVDIAIVIAVGVAALSSKSLAKRVDLYPKTKTAPQTTTERTADEN